MLDCNNFVYEKLFSREKNYDMGSLLHVKSYIKQTRAKINFVTSTSRTRTHYTHLVQKCILRKNAFSVNKKVTL